MNRYSEKEIRDVLDDERESRYIPRYVLDMLRQLLDDRRWIPVSERLPNESGCYLVYISNTPFFQRNVVFYNAHDNVWHSGDEIVSHWMPLPPPPEVKP